MFTSNTAEVPAGQSESYKIPPRTRRRKHQYNSVTTLPVLDDKVSGIIEYGGSRSHWALLAIHLLDSGFLKPNEKGNVIELCQKGMSKWLEQQTNPLNTYAMEIQVSPDISMEGIEYYGEDQRPTVDNQELFIRFTIDDGILQFNIGEKLMRLEQLAPGLGKTAYYSLAVEGARHFEVFTPWMGRSLAANTWWMGFDEMEDFEEELKFNEVTLEEHGYPSPDQWDMAFPEWTTNICEELKAEMLKELAGHHKDAYVREVADAILSVQALNGSEMPSLYGTELQSAYSGIYLFWGGDQDMGPRLIDDYMEHVNMSADYYSNDLGLVQIPRDLAEIGKLFEKLETGFKQMKNLERLISLVGVQI